MINAKCVCGYEYERGIGEDGAYGLLKGDEEFHRVMDAFHLFPQNSWDTPQGVHILVCPKCGTLRAERKR